MKTAKELQLMGEVRKNGSTFVSFVREYWHWRWIEKQLKTAVKKGYSAISFRPEDVSDIELYRLYSLDYVVEEVENSRKIRVSW